ncbi:MAG: hypothetical protein LIO56_02670 [Lachnospiraceae bacterium]|nr:hypothetical protein [Lachnospiraceae bacterium]
MQDKINTGFALMAELQNYEQHGITIWLEGSPSSPGRVYDAIRVREGFSFMRDYVFEEEELREVRFDRVEEL